MPARALVLALRNDCGGNMGDCASIVEAWDILLPTIQSKEQAQQEVYW